MLPRDSHDVDSSTRNAGCQSQKPAGCADASNIPLESYVPRATLPGEPVTTQGLVRCLFLQDCMCGGFSSRPGGLEIRPA
jgi:hypothetical protein